MTDKLSNAQIAWRAAQDITDGAYVNLGIGFPEGVLPGHPGWVELLPQDRRAYALSKRLFQNAVEVPGPAIDAVARACAQGGIGAVLGVCERRPRTTGTLFNAQVFIDASGRVAEKHQKLVPTVGERVVRAR